MRRYSFSTFTVDDTNREAFEVCRAVAELRSVTPLPVVIVADEGCGKTHLIYSIIGRVRADSAKTGIACVTAREFPEPVRALLTDPSPVVDADSAVLLVDQLEEFGDRAADLEAVVRLFLENEHYVVMASSVHPARLKQLPEGLRSLMSAGRVVHIKPRSVLEIGEAPTPVIQAEDVVEKQREDIRALREELAALRRETDAADARTEATEFQRQLDAERGRTADLALQMEAERQEQEALRAEADRAHAEIRVLRRDLDQAQTQLAEAETANEELSRLRRELERTQAEREALERKHAALAVQLEQTTLVEEDVQALRLQLHTARQNEERAQQEADRVLERSQALVAVVEANRVKLAEAEREHLAMLQDLETRIAEQTDQPTELEAAGALDALRQEYEARLAAAKAETSNVVRARDNAWEKLDQLVSAHAALELETEHIRAELQQRTEDLEALRREAAGQVAAAQTQAGEVERKCLRLIEAMKQSHETSNVAAAGIQDLRQRLIESSEAMAQLAARLAESTDLETNPSAGGNGGGQPDTAMRREPGNDKPLLDALDSALAQSAGVLELRADRTATVDAETPPPFDLRETPSEA